MILLLIAVIVLLVFLAWKADHAVSLLQSICYYNEMWLDEKPRKYPDFDNTGHCPESTCQSCPNPAYCESQRNQTNVGH